MTQVPATLGDKSAPSLVIISSMLAFYFAAKAIGSFADGEVWWAMADTLVAGLGAFGAIKTWIKWRRGVTRLQWDGGTAQITHGDKILFSGDLASIDPILEDGRGFFLHLDRKLQVRLRRQDVPPELAKALENRIAQQGAAPNRLTRSESDFSRD